MFSCLESDKETELSTTFPQTQYVIMSNADTAKILGKLKEFNESAAGDVGLRLTDVQLQQIDELANGNTVNLEEKLTLLFQLLKWPISKTSINLLLHVIICLL